MLLLCPSLLAKRFGSPERAWTGATGRSDTEIAREQACRTGHRMGWGEKISWAGMSAKIIDGAALAQSTKENVRGRVAELAAKKRAGGAGGGAGRFDGGGGALRRQAGGGLPRIAGSNTSCGNLPAIRFAAGSRDSSHSLNNDPAFTGIMLHLPLPAHLDATELQYKIDPVKDVEGVNPANIGYVVYGHTRIAPCTALAVIELIESTGVQLRGAEAVVVGASEIAGKPIALLLTERMATITTCHVATRDLALHTRRAEILVVAVGKPGLIAAEHVRHGAVVIDVGINRITLPDGTKKTVGDVEFDSVKEKAGYITPVPGGVGPMTVAMLLKNTVRSAELSGAT